MYFIGLFGGTVLFCIYKYSYSSGPKATFCFDAWVGGVWQLAKDDWHLDSLTEEAAGTAR